MTTTRIRRALAIGASAILTTLAPIGATAQQPGVPPSVAGADSVTIVPGAHYRAGGIRRALLGGTYRDLWTTPIRVPVLDLHTFGGGLVPTKEGGGHQTKSLHLATADGTTYVFRSVDKDAVVVPEMWQGTVVEKAAKDVGSNAHPAGSLVAAALLEAAGVLHVTPVFVVMPDDKALGKFRATYAGRLGAIEMDPAGPKADTPGFAGATAMIESDSLLARIDRDPSQQVDARRYLAARLMDMLLNDWDRGPSQWKWATFRDGAGSSWRPIPRDRDDALYATSGMVPPLAAASSHQGQRWGPRYGPLSNFTYQSGQLDERVLSSLDRPAWDSVAAALRARLTDPVIDAAVHRMPREYWPTAAVLRQDLRVRRDSIPAQAARFYSALADIVDINATDASDRATVRRVDDDHVEVRLQSGDAAPYFDRTFVATETREIRLYLHGGDDRAEVSGIVDRSIRVRVIGGNGQNTLIDSSRVGGNRSPSHFYDAGTVSGVTYGPDTLFDRRPRLDVAGGPVSPIRDHGGVTGPTGGVTINNDFGFMPRLGLTRHGYAFDRYPYSSMVAIDGRYSTKLSRYKVEVMTDNRLENSNVHYATLAQLSQLDVVNFHGYGNDTPGADTAYYVAHESQWMFHPTIALALGPTTDLSFGPSFQYSTADTLPGHFIADNRPYGFGTAGQFGEASLRVSVTHDNRVPRRHAAEGSVFALGASYTPAVWDVTSGFGEVDAAAGWYTTMGFLTRPEFAIRGGVKKVWGDFPFEDAAFIGGSTTIRTEAPERYAGDAAVYGTAELRVPLVTLPILVPIDIGLLGTVDYGRVYVDGNSPGGWHNAYGGGFWIGFRNLVADIRVMRADDIGRSVVTLRLAMPTGVAQ